MSLFLPGPAILLAALAAAMHPLRSQEPAPERASFYLLLRGDTIFEERENRTPTELSGEFRDRLRNVRVTYDATLNASALVTHVDLRTFRSPQSAGDPASFTIGGDSIVAKIGDAAPAKIPSISGAVAVVNPAVGFIEQIVLRARAPSWSSSSAVRSRSRERCGDSARIRCGCSTRARRWISPSRRQDACSAA